MWDRVKIIDWMCETMHKFQIQDRALLFQAVEIMDSYYHECFKDLPKEDL